MCPPISNKSIIKNNPISSTNIENRPIIYLLIIFKSITVSLIRSSSSSVPWPETISMKINCARRTSSIQNIIISKNISSSSIGSHNMIVVYIPISRFKIIIFNINRIPRSKNRIYVFNPRRRSITLTLSNINNFSRSIKETIIIYNSISCT